MNYAFSFLSVFISCAGLLVQFLSVRFVIFRILLFYPEFPFIPVHSAVFALVDFSFFGVMAEGVFAWCADEFYGAEEPGACLVFEQLC